MFRYAIAALLVTALSACGSIYAPSNVNGASDAKAKAVTRQVVDPADIPELFKGCTGTHDSESYLVLSEEGPTYAVTERNSRKCPPVQLNLLIPDDMEGTTDGPFVGVGA